MGRLPPASGLRYNENVLPPGAQTERRGLAGPGRDLLRGENSPADLLSRCSSCPVHLIGVAVAGNRHSRMLPSLLPERKRTCSRRMLTRIRLVLLLKVHEDRHSFKKIQWTINRSLHAIVRVATTGFATWNGIGQTLKDKGHPLTSSRLAFAGSLRVFSASAVSPLTRHPFRCPPRYARHTPPPIRQASDHPATNAHACAWRPPPRSGLSAHLPRPHRRSLVKTLLPP